MSAPPTVRVVSWNLNCGVFTEKGTASEAESYIAYCLRRLEPDIVALQEVLFPRSTAGPTQAQEIARQVGLPHVAEFALSPSHLIEGADLGLAVLSRFPIIEVQHRVLPNLNIQVRTSNDKFWTSHDKGFLVVRVNSSVGEVSFVSGHLPPFHRFDRHPGDPEFVGFWQAVGDILAPLANQPVIACIDFNTAEAASLLPSCFAAGLYRELIHQPTRPTGERHDQISCSQHWSGVSLRVLPSHFDHHLCFADLTLSQEQPTQQRPPAAYPATSITLLHLSDLHFGPGTREDVDWKTYIELATRETRRERLVYFLRSLPKAPDYVVVSGDVTIAGSENGYVSFVQTFQDLIRDGFLPPADRILVVPGNHDVVRGATNQIARWELFLRHVGVRFVRPWIPEHDPPQDQLLKRVDAALDNDAERWGGIRREEDPRLGTTNVYSLPFIFDRPKGLLLYAFNSAAISGTKIQLAPDIEKAAQWLRNWDGPNNDKVRTVLKALEHEIEVDPARIDPPELALFTSILERLRRRVPHELDGALKVAVLHHHIAPVLSEEVAKFESLLNAGRFKRELKGEGFHLVLHGHKHWPEVFQDSALPGERPLWIVSGGTIGGGEASGHTPGFFLLKHEPSIQGVSARFIPLLESGNPRHAFEQARVINLKLDRLENQSDEGAQLRLPDLYAKTEQSLLAYLRRQVTDEREWWGWSHALDERRVSMVATAYGLRILGLIRAGCSELRHRLPNILDTLIAYRHMDGGWSANSQSGLFSQPEPTAFALAALCIWNHSLLGDAVRSLEARLEPASDPLLWQHGYSLATVTRVLAECAPQSTFLARLSASLIQAAHLDDRGCFRCWGRQTLRFADDGFGSTGARGSVIHTAHAIYALSRTYKATQGKIGVAPEDLRDACEYLLECPEWNDTTEDINRQVLPNNKYDRLGVKHFTLPWVLMALLEAGTDPENTRIRTGVRELLGSHRNGLWDWGLVERPIWATHDALSALTLYASVAARV